MTEPTLALNKTEVMIHELLTLQKYANKMSRKDFFYSIMSPNVTEIVKALNEFHKAMPDMKTDKETVGGKIYKYQSFPALLKAVTPVLTDCNCIFTQTVCTIAGLTYVVTMVVHTSGQFFKSATMLPEKYNKAGKTVNTADDMHAFGGAITYIKRYALKAMLGIDADDDTDGNF